PQPAEFSGRVELQLEQAVNAFVPDKALQRARRESHPAAVLRQRHDIARRALIVSEVVLRRDRQTEKNAVVVRHEPDGTEPPSRGYSPRDRPCKVCLLRRRPGWPACQPSTGHRASPEATPASTR